ncbi:MAG: LysR family transcriptional regulator [Gemmataceae bacterium]
MSRSQRYKDIQLAQLRGFTLAATEGNFTTAAKALGTSVPTVWQQVRALEHKLGATLIWRRGRLLELTPEGRLLLELIQPHVNALDSLERLFETRRAELPQQLNVAATYYLFADHLPACFQEFTAQHPTVRLNLRASIWPDVVRAVERGEVDLGLVSYAPEAPRSPHLSYEPIFPLYFTLFTSNRHPLARKKRVTPADLVQYPIISSTKATFGHQTLERILRKHDLFERIHVIMESPSTDLLRKYVALDLGIALAYVSERNPPFPGLTWRIFDPTLEPVLVYLIHRKGAHLSSPVLAFREVVRSLLGK